MESVISLLELAGTLAFSASGAMTGLRKHMDVFGVCILGLTTAVGGGVIRDLILGRTPPATFQNPIYAAAALAAALVLFFCPHPARWLTRDQRRYDRVLFWMDAAGLGIFTVHGHPGGLCGQLVPAGDVPAGVRGGRHRRGRRGAAGRAGGGHPLHLRPGTCTPSRLPGGGDWCAACCGRPVGEMPAMLTGTGAGDADPLPLRPLPVEPAHAQE